MKKFLLLIAITIGIAQLSQAQTIYKVSQSSISHYNYSTQSWIEDNRYYPDNMSLIMNGMDITVDAKNPVYLRLKTNKATTYHNGDPVLNYEGMMDGVIVSVKFYMDSEGAFTDMCIFKNTRAGGYICLDYRIN